MITTITRFRVPETTSRAELLEVFRQSTARYRDLPGLIRKYYLLDGPEGTAGAVYLWESRAAAEAVFTEDWRRSFAERYGVAPEVDSFETPVVVDNLTGETLDAETGQ